MSFRNTYGWLDRCLHRLAFATPSAQLGVADMEQRMFRAELEGVTAAKPILVTGLPRASWRLGANRGCMDLALVDTDGDGRVELAVSNNHSADVSLLRFPVDDGAAGD